MSPEEAYSLLECIAKLSGTEDRLKKMKPEGHEVLDEETALEIEREARLGPFKFSMCDIIVGEKIQFVNNPAKEAEVVDDRHIRYKGVTTSMSALARELLGVDHQIAGPQYWMYKGEVLSELRLRLSK